ncbi:hypothetical protein FRB93_011927 [Tulasnella sp. JGI-2019a]|nr:hypothetical protein FRB93_011927 [Tulasnella sp. JGI-2019a]
MNSLEKTSSVAVDEEVKRHPDYRPEAFGDKSNFWEDYNKLAGSQDMARYHRLGDNLDAMLIFAGLFSGVNTAFICLSVVNLSPIPSDETNALLRLLITTTSNSTSSALAAIASTASNSRTSSVRSNCLLFASLSCSLLSAAAAVTAKQWLVRCQRTSAVGTPDYLGRIRQKKFMGVERCHFEAVLEALPSLLMLSFVLFFAAVVDYLWDINRPVAYVVLSFIVTGATAYIVSVVAAVADEDCPYQSSLVDYIRTSYHHISKLLRLSKSSRNTSPAPRRHGETGPDYFDKDAQKMREEEERLNVLSLRWMMDQTSDHRNLLQAAKNIPLIYHPENLRLIPASPYIENLRSAYKISVATLNSDGGSDTSFANAAIYSRAMLHLQTVHKKDLWETKGFWYNVQVARKEDIPRPDLRLLINVALEYNWPEFKVDEMDLVEADPETRLLFFKALVVKPFPVEKHVKDRVIGQLFDAIAALLMSLDERKLDDALISSVSLLLIVMFDMKIHFCDPMATYVGIPGNLWANLSVALATFTPAAEMAESKDSSLKLGSVATVHAILASCIQRYLSPSDLIGLAYQGKQPRKHLRRSLARLLKTSTPHARWLPYPNHASKRIETPGSMEPRSHSKGDLFHSILIALDNLTTPDSEVDQHHVETIWQAAEHVQVTDSPCDQGKAVVLLRLLEKTKLDSRGEVLSRCIKISPHTLRFIVQCLSSNNESIRHAALKVIANDDNDWFSPMVGGLEEGWRDAGLGPTIRTLLDGSERYTPGLCWILACLWRWERWQTELDASAVVRVCFRELQEGQGTHLVAGKLLLQAWCREGLDGGFREWRADEYRKGILTYMQAVVEEQKRRQSTRFYNLPKLAELDPETFQLLTHFMQNVDSQDDVATGLVAAVQATYETPMAKQDGVSNRPLTPFSWISSGEEYRNR